jgi:hypothetical protein
MLLAQILDLAKSNGMPEDANLVEWLEYRLSQQENVVKTTHCLVRLVQALGRGKVAAIGGGSNGMSTVTIPAQSAIPEGAQCAMEIQELFDGAGDLIITTKVTLPGGAARSCRIRAEQCRPSELSREKNSLMKKLFLALTLCLVASPALAGSDWNMSDKLVHVTPQPIKMLTNDTITLTPSTMFGMIENLQEAALQEHLRVSDMRDACVRNIQELREEFAKENLKNIELGINPLDAKISVLERRMSGAAERDKRYQFRIEELERKVEGLQKAKTTPAQRRSKVKKSKF